MAMTRYLVCCAVIVYIIKCTAGQGDLCEGGTCYHYNSTPATWNKAADSCDQQGSLLVPVVNSDVQEALTKVMKYEDATDVWLGGFNEKNETDAPFLWRWIDGQPVGYQGCHVEYYTPARASLYNLESPNIANLVPNLCIQACQNYDYVKLRNGNSCTCTNTLQEYTTTDCNNPCVGDATLTCGGSQNSDVYVSKGIPIRWVPKTKLHNRRYTCGQLIVTTFMNTTGYNEGICTEDKRYLCDIADSSCRADSASYVRVGAQCVYIGTTATSWYEAHQQCIIKGGMLSMPKTDAQLDPLIALITSLRTSNSLSAPGGQVELWVGLSRQFFLWLTKDTLKDKSAQEVLYFARTSNQITYTNFAPNQPDPNNNNCLRATKADNYTWSELLCVEKRPYFCIYDEKTTTSTTTPTTTTGPTTTTITPSTATTTAAPGAATTTQAATTTTNDDANLTTTAATAATTATTTQSGTTPAPTTTPGSNPTNTSTPNSGGSTQNEGLDVVIIVVIVIVIILIIIAIIVLIVCVVLGKKKRRIRPDPSGDPVARTNGVSAHGMPPSLSTIPPEYANDIKSKPSHSDTTENHVIVDASTVHNEGSGQNRRNGIYVPPLAIHETTDRPERRTKKKKRQQGYETTSSRTTTIVLGSPRKGDHRVPDGLLDPRRIRQNYKPRSGHLLNL